jgi:acyl dehydratase
MTRSVTTVATGIEELKALAGSDLGATAWREITKGRVDTFADATDDHQWIHVDAERARTGPFGTTIAHGYLTLALLPSFGEQIYSIDGLAFGMNYGANKVRFPAPAPVDSRLRATATLKETSEIAIGTQGIVNFVIELEGSEKPACVAEVVFVMAAA